MKHSDKCQPLDKRPPYLGTAGSLVLALALAACNEIQPPIHSTDYYAHHPKEANVELKVCDAAALGDRGAECVNAQDGLLQAVMTAPSHVNPWSSK